MNSNGDEVAALLNARSRKTIGRNIAAPCDGARRLPRVEEDGSALPAPPRAPARLITRTAKEFAARTVTWLWPKWLPAGKLTIMDGFPGDGKSHVATSIAAALTTGRPLPGCLATTPTDVLWLSYEEDPNDTIRPRLEAAGADLERVHLVEGVDRGDGTPGEVSTEHVALIEEKFVELHETGNPVRLLVVDPLSLVLPTRTDTNNDAASRQALQPLARLAQRNGVAVLVIRHFNKGRGERALLKGGGSIAFAAAARAVWTVTDHPSEVGYKVLAAAKLSNGQKAPARAFRIVGALLPPTADAPHGIETSVLEWGEELPLSADELLAATYEDADVRDDRVDCGEWLVDFLKSQPEQKARADQVMLAARSAGFAERTVRRAARRQGVQRDRVGYGTGSVYSLRAIHRSGQSAQSGSATVPERDGLPERDDTLETFWDALDE